MADGPTIREIQLVELEILNAVADLCEKHGVRYALYCGTLLGAVRHGGFIPWDDDVDIAMPLKDYYRFLEVADELPKGFVAQSPYNASNHAKCWTRVCADGTTNMTPATAMYGEHGGIFLDVYPMIGAARTKLGERMQSVALRLSCRLRSVRHYRAQLATGLAGEGSKVVFKRILSVLPAEPLRRLGLAILPWALRDMTDADRIGTVDAVPFAGKYLKSDWAEVTKASFEGREFTIPAMYGKILCIMYGDWTQLPCETERVPHYEAEGAIRDVHRDYREYGAEFRASMRDRRSSRKSRRSS